MGRFSKTIKVPTEIGTNWQKAAARPVMPPAAMAFGIKKVFRPKAQIIPPIKIKVQSQICFFIRFSHSAG